MEFRDILVSNDRTHHVYKDKPLYPQRFDWVLKFHDPGLAPVGDTTGAYHITLEGKPAYGQRYLRTFGYYHNRAAVITRYGWAHIDVKGNFVYDERYSWVGNYQEGCSTVRDSRGYYFHIGLDGTRLYLQNYKYAGDFRDEIAVVRQKNGLCTHIDKNGEYIHKRDFLDLDVYHKGFARARDKRGWFHVDLSGKAVYEERFFLVEAFYNGYALVHCFNGEIGIINECGEWVHTVMNKGGKNP